MQLMPESLKQKLLLFCFFFLTFPLFLASTITVDTIRAEQYISAAWTKMEMNPIEANTVLDSSIQFIDTNVHLELWASYLSKKGVYHSYNYKKDSALFYFLKGLTIRKKIGNKKDLVQSYINVGTFYLEEEEYDSAEEHFEKGAKIALTEKDSLNSSICYTNLAILYQRKEIYDTAIVLYKVAEQLMSSNENMTSSDWLNRGSFYLDNKDLNSAYPYIMKAIDLAHKDSNFIDLALSYFNMGVLYANQGNNDSAIVFFQKSVIIAQKAKYTSTEKDALKEIQKENVRISD